MPIELQLLLGYLLGDFFSGLFHWWEDRYGSLTWPKWLVDHVVLSNIEHHQFPANTCKRTYWYRCGDAILATAPFIIVAIYYQWHLLAMGLATLSQANEVHAWAHKKANWFIRFFQRTGFFLSPQHHNVHHRQPYTERYCVITNYLNPILSFVRFWTVLETVTWLVLGVTPNKDREVY